MSNAEVLKCNNGKNSMTVNYLVIVEIINFASII